MAFNRLKTVVANRFFRSVLVLTGGTVAGQAVIILVLPFLTRIYAPQDFGLLAVYSALVGILSVAACLRFDIAIMLPKHTVEALNLMALAMMVASAISLALVAGALLWPRSIAGLLNQPDMAPYLWMVALGVWLAAIFSAVRYWNIRNKRFNNVAMTQLTRAIGGAGTQVGFGLAQPSPFGLLFGQMLFGGLGTLGLSLSILRYDRQKLQQISFRGMRHGFKENWRFPAFSAPESLLDAAANNLPVILIAALATIEEAGFMMLALRITGVPVALLGRNISSVYLSEAPTQHQQGNLGSFTRQIMKNLFLVGIGPFILVGVTAPFLFPYVFGTEWARAGVMVSWMVPYMIMQFVTSPVSTILYVMGHQRRALALQAFGFVLMLGTVILGAHLTSVYVFEFFASASMIYYAVYLTVVMKLSSQKETKCVE